MLNKKTVPETRIFHNRHGLTLIEVIVSAVILVGLLGMVLAIYFQCGQSWKRGVTESRSQTSAWWAQKRMAPDVRKAASVTPFPEPYEGYGVSLQLPERNFNADEKTYFNTVSLNSEGRPYLVDGNTVNYFRGDVHGYPSITGDRLWRVVAAADGTIIKREVVVDGVCDNPVTTEGYPKPMFIYWPDIFRLRSLEATITVESREGTRKTATTLTAETALRNR